MQDVWDARRERLQLPLPLLWFTNGRADRPCRRNDNSLGCVLDTGARPHRVEMWSNSSEASNPNARAKAILML